MHFYFEFNTIDFFPPIHHVNVLSISIVVEGTTDGKRTHFRSESAINTFDPTLWHYGPFEKIGESLKMK